MEHFHRIHHIAPLQQSPRVPVKNERKARIIYKTDHLHIDVQRPLMVISRQLNRNAIKTPTSFSVHARRFSPGRRSFLGPGSEKNWCSTHDSNPQGERDRVAEQMMMEFSEIGHPVFPCYESIVTRNAQKLRWWKIIITLLR